MKFFERSKSSRFDDEDEARIVAAIDAAERGTHGEVRVHVEGTCDADDVIERAREVFHELDMTETERGTGVLLYIAEDDRRAAVWAGKGLYEARQPDFWQEVIDAVSAGYSAGDRVMGIETALSKVSDALDEIAGGADVHGNELPDALTTED